ncbi:MAG TPA: aminotransferase class V-fold PLP-dependent enzyme [Gemmatimonadales bacterium]|nr:aminotransferase class V-fold PLP-dependent enzyme [Gemmatimonadales bacterium]
MGDFLAAVTNKYSGIFLSGPGAVRMEHMVVRWVADLVGYPAGAGGHVASGGSIATLAAVAAARDGVGLGGADYAGAAVYLTDQAHLCVEKALRIAGMKEVPVRRVPVNGRHRMRPDALAEAIGADRARGLRPWLVVATAGTTDTGAVDPLDAIADVADRERCWLHVDAAYGGFFLLTGHGRALLRGLGRSDSAVLDPHKSLFLPWGAGVVAVRDAARLAGAHPTLPGAARARPGAIPCCCSTARGATSRISSRSAGCSCPGRRGPGLRGGSPARSLDRHLPLGAARRRPGVRRPAQPGDRGRGRRDGRVFLSSTTLGGRFTLRLAALTAGTHRRHVDLALRVLAEQVAALGH